MSIRTTDRSTVALYDSVSGRAKGPTFADAEHAQDFLRWLHDQDLSWHDLDAQGLGELHGTWFDERCDPETGILLELDAA